MNWNKYTEWNFKFWLIGFFHSRIEKFESLTNNGFFVSCRTVRNFCAIRYIFLDKFPKYKRKMARRIFVALEFLICCLKIFMFLSKRFSCVGIEINNSTDIFSIYFLLLRNVKNNVDIFHFHMSQKFFYSYILLPLPDERFCIFVCDFGFAIRKWTNK